MNNFMSKISKEIIQNIKNEVSYWNNVDFRYVGLPHMSNHLNFLIYHYSLIFPKSKWPKMIVCGNLMMRNGEKISKSKGNGTPLYRIKKEIGADLYRLYIALSSNYDIELDFKDDEVKNLENKFLKLIDLLEKSTNKKAKKFLEYDEIDKTLISNFYKNSLKYFENFDNFKIREAYISIFYDTLNQIGQNIRRNQNNFEKTYSCISFFLEDFLILLTPIIPHSCEEIYEKIKKDENDFISLKSFNTNPKDFIDDTIIQKEIIIEKILKSVSKKIEENNNFEKIILYQSKTKRFELFKKLKKLLEEEKEFKKIFETLNNDFKDDLKFIKKFVPKCLKDGIGFFLEKKEEKLFLQNNLDFFESEFNKKFEIFDLDNSEKNLNLNPGEIGIELK